MRFYGLWNLFIWFSGGKFKIVLFESFVKKVYVNFQFEFKFKFFFSELKGFFK